MIERRSKLGKNKSKGWKFLWLFIPKFDMEISSVASLFQFWSSVFKCVNHTVIMVEIFCCKFFLSSSVSCQYYLLTLLWQRSLSFTNQSIDFFYKSMDWFLYDNDLRHERVKQIFPPFFSGTLPSIELNGIIDTTWVYKSAACIFRNSPQASSQVKGYMHVPCFENLPLKSNLTSSRKNNGKIFWRKTFFCC